MNQSWDEMFTPFIQYTIDGQREQNVLSIAEVVGCLTQGASGTWMLSNASDPIVSMTQSTSLADLEAATTKPLGNQRDQLLGVSAFNPASQKGQKVAVKGVLIKDAKENRINVTSLQKVATTCF
jgi:hypothetical protein